MAAAIIGGLVNRGIDKQKIHVAEPWDVNRDKLKALGVKTTASNAEAAQDADIVVLAVKPQVTKVVCQELSTAWAKRPKLPIIVSIAAGVTLDSLKSWSTLTDGRIPHVVRVMPNTPALVGEGASGLYTSSEVSGGEKELVTSLIGSISKSTEWVDKEELIDVVTGLSGSGPAYFFNMVEHLITSAVKLGLSKDQATRLAKQTCFGAGKMLLESSEDPSQLRANVTSPNGTTHAALETFKSLGFEEMVHKSVKAAAERGAELGETLGKQ